MPYKVLSLSLFVRLIVLASVFLASGEVTASGINRGLSRARRTSIPTTVVGLGSTLESIDFDTLNIRQVNGSTVLAAGQPYILTASGTFSYWSVDKWNRLCAKSLQPENQPLIPSPGTVNAQVGVDAEFIFAYPDAFGNCSSFLQSPFRWLTFNRQSEFQISVNGGASWLSLISLEAQYNPSHTYNYYLSGAGFALRVRQTDNPLNDNYGVVRFAVSDCAQCSTLYLPLVRK